MSVILMNQSEHLGLKILAIQKPSDFRCHFFDHLSCLACGFCFMFQNDLAYTPSPLLFLLAVLLFLVLFWPFKTDGSDPFLPPLYAHGKKTNKNNKLLLIGISIKLLVSCVVRASVAACWTWT